MLQIEEKYKHKMSTRRNGTQTISTGLVSSHFKPTRIIVKISVIIRVNVPSKVAAFYSLDAGLNGFIDLLSYVGIRKRFRVAGNIY